MSKQKNISGGALDVPLLDRTVADGETVDVPDAQGDGTPIVWPENRWQPVADDKKTAKAPAAAAADETKAAS